MYLYKKREYFGCIRNNRIDNRHNRVLINMEGEQKAR